MRKFTHTQLEDVAAATRELQSLADGLSYNIGALYPDNGREPDRGMIQAYALELNGVVAQLTEAWEALQEMPTLGRPEDGESVELAVCDDCYMLDNGLSEHETGQPYPAAVLESMERISADNGGALIEIIPTSGQFDIDGEPLAESFFSWGRCEQCLSNLGGDRHVVTLMIGSVHPAGI